MSALALAWQLARRLQRIDWRRAAWRVAGAVLVVAAVVAAAYAAAFVLYSVLYLWWVPVPAHTWQAYFDYADPRHTRTEAHFALADHVSNATPRQSDQSVIFALIRRSHLAQLALRDFLIILVVRCLTGPQDGAVFSSDHPYRLWAELALPANEPNRDAGVFMVELLLSATPVPRHVAGDTTLPTDRPHWRNGSTCVARPAHVAHRPLLLDWVLQALALPWQAWC